MECLWIKCWCCLNFLYVATLFPSLLGNAAEFSRLCCPMPWKSCVMLQSHLLFLCEWVSHDLQLHSLWRALALMLFREVRSSSLSNLFLHDLPLTSPTGQWRSRFCSLVMTMFSYVSLPFSSNQTAASYIIRNPQPRRSSQSQPVRGRDEEQDDIVSADVEEVGCRIIKPFES